MGLARSLAEAGAKIVFTGLLDPAASASDLQRLPADVDWRVVPGRSLPRSRTVFSRLPFEAKRFGTASHRRTLARLMRTSRFDAVVLDHYSAVWALPFLEGRAANLVLIAHNCESELSLGIAKAFRGGRLKGTALRVNALRTGGAERRLVAAADLVVAITARDADAFTRMGARKALVLTPGYEGPAAPGPLSAQRRAILLGSFRWVAKQMNLRAFLEAADARFADAGIELDVVGPMPAGLRRELSGALRATRLLGWVEDPQPHLRSARIGVVPEATGGGFKLKILDYVFAGLPVVGLDQALVGLPQGLRDHTAGAPGFDGLVELVCRLMDDEAAALAMREGALCESRSLFEWRTRGESLKAALSSLTPASSG